MGERLKRRKLYYVYKLITEDKTSDLGSFKKRFTPWNNIYIAYMIMKVLLTNQVILEQFVEKQKILMLI